MIAPHIPNCHCADCDVARAVERVEEVYHPTCPCIACVAARRIAAGGSIFHTEPTDQGNQYVIPGCEHDRSRGPSQGDLFK